jgi:hypothetical protein
MEMTGMSPYLVYLVRLWQVEGDVGPVWRVVLEDPQDGQRRGFSDLQSLTAYLAETMAAVGGGDATYMGRTAEGDER